MLIRSKFFNYYKKNFWHKKEWHWAIKLNFYQVT
jgi:hypothetical protein